MSHIVKEEKGNNVLTHCNRNIQKGAIGTAKRKGRRPPFFYLGDGPWSNKGATLYSMTEACRQCVEALPKFYKDTWLVKVHKYLKEMKEIHIIENLIASSGVKMMCGKMWDASSLFNNGIGYIEIQDLNNHFDKPQFCSDCTEHPHAQLQILAGADLGEWE